MTVQETAGLIEAPAVEAPNGQPLTVLNILIGIIIRPRATFKSLREANKGYWWLAFLITVAALLLYTVVSASVMANARQGFTPPVGVVAGGDAATAVPQAAQSSSFVTIGVPLAAGIVTILLGYVFRSLIAFGASLIMGGHSTFKQTFCMAVWTTIPSVFRHVIHTIAVATTQGRIISGLSGVMTTLEARSLPFLNTLLGQIDFYTIWSLVLLGIGIAVTTRLGKGKSTAAVLIYIVVSVLGLLIYYVVGNAVGGLFGGGIQQGPGMMRGVRG